MLEADIFPHYIVAFASRCRNQPPAPDPLFLDQPQDQSFDELLPIRPRESWLRPCISVTPAVRLRMLVGESAPVPAPSFMLRANAQWLFWQTHEDPGTNIQGHTLSNFYFQIAHHSNGQSRCLFIWTHAGTCVTDGVDSGTKKPGQPINSLSITCGGDSAAEDPSLRGVMFRPINLPAISR